MIVSLATLLTVTFAYVHTYTHVLFFWKIELSTMSREWENRMPIFFHSALYRKLGEAESVIYS